LINVTLTRVPADRGSELPADANQVEAQAPSIEEVDDRLLASVRTYSNITAPLYGIAKRSGLLLAQPVSERTALKAPCSTIIDT
jgi:hypothetical protein